MRATVLSMGAILLTACLVTAAAHADMQDDINQAVSVLERFQEIPESAIPDVILRDAKGLAILTLTKGGFVFSGRGGSGIVVARTETRVGAVPRRSAREGWDSVFRLGLKSLSLCLSSTLLMPSSHSRKVATSPSEAP